VGKRKKNLGNLENQIKTIAKQNGATLVGIASKERLMDAPPSANPEYILPSARSAISLALSFNRKTIRSFLGKKEWLSHGDDRQQVARKLYLIGDSITDFLRSNGYDAVVVGVNNNFRPEEGARDVTEMTEFYPDFAHRYGAIAAGIARLGWSGNVLNPEYGALLELGTVLTSAELEPDPLLVENPCDKCKMCALVCPVEMISKKKTKQVGIAGITDEIAVKKPNTCCWIGCTGYQGLSKDKTWSNWSPYRLASPLPEDKNKLDELNIRLQKADPLLQLEDSSFTDYRKAAFNPDWHFATVCGNCRVVCWEKRTDREENMRILTSSGVVALSPDGQHVVAKDEIVELDTPYIVKVAVLEKDYEAAQRGSFEIGKGFIPVDGEVLKHVFRCDSKG
jgi:epoxyqueuosine reductase QueG